MLFKRYVCEMSTEGANGERTSVCRVVLRSESM